MPLFTDHAQFERAILSLERAVGASVTVIDYQGRFHTPAGLLVFPSTRQSHRKLPVCNAGFSSTCIDFCRHEMNRISATRQSAFVKQCWKKVVEIVAPLRHGNEHWGMCYLGPWRMADCRWKEVEGMPPEYGTAYQALPVWREELFGELSPLLEAFAAGIVASLVALKALEEPPPRRKQEIVAYLQAHAADPGISLQGLANALSLSTSRTSRLLREVCQSTFPALLREIRVNRAKTLLLSSDEKLAMIAAVTGFSDEYHFSKVFRRVTGTSPGAFRRVGSTEGC